MKQIIFMLSIVGLGLGVYSLTRPAIRIQSAKTPQIQQVPAQQQTERGARSQHAAHDVQQVPPSSERKPVGQVTKLKPGDEQREGGHEQQRSVAPTLAAVWTELKITDLFGLFFTSVLAWVGYQQLRTYRQQANIMSEQLKVAADAARASEMAAKASQQQAITAQAALHAGYRPWLDFTCDLVSDLRWNQVGAEVTLCVRIENFGSAPAIHTDLTPCFQVRLPGGKWPSYKLDEMWTSHIPAGGELRAGFVGAVFPRSIREEFFTVYVTQAEIEKNQKACQDQYGESNPFSGKVIGFEILLLVVYKNPYGELTHNTRKSFTLSMPHPDIEGFRKYNFTIGEDIPLDTLALTKELFCEHAE